MTSSTDSRYEILKLLLLFFSRWESEFCSEKKLLPVFGFLLLLLPFVRCCSLPSAEVQSVGFSSFSGSVVSFRSIKLYAQPTPRLTNNKEKQK